MDYFIYVLYSKKDRNLYIGQTNNLTLRLKEHFTGKVRSTKYRHPLYFVKSEKYKSRLLAMKREKYLKSLFGYKERKKILDEFLSDGSSRF